MDKQRTKSKKSKPWEPVQTICSMHELCPSLSPRQMLKTKAAQCGNTRTHITSEMNRCASYEKLCWKPASKTTKTHRWRWTGLWTSQSYVQMFKTCTVTIKTIRSTTCRQRKHSELKTNYGNAHLQEDNLHDQWNTPLTTANKHINSIHKHTSHTCVLLTGSCISRTCSYLQTIRNKLCEVVL